MTQESPEAAESRPLAGYDVLIEPRGGYSTPVHLGPDPLPAWLPSDGRGSLSGSRGLVDEREPARDAAIFAAFRHEFTVVDTVQIEAEPDRAGPLPITVRTRLRAERAMIVVRQGNPLGDTSNDLDAFYSWVFPTKHQRRSWSFIVEPAEHLGSPREPPPLTGFAVPRPIPMTLQLIVIVFHPPWLARLVAPLAGWLRRAAFIGRLLVYAFERQFKKGQHRVVAIGGPPGNWEHVRKVRSAPALAGLRASPRPRLLLLLHGTASNTTGAFQGMTFDTVGGPAPVEPGLGRRLLAETTLRPPPGPGFDAVIGFDHPTLSVSPRWNALRLGLALRRIARSCYGGGPLEVVVVTHSRGALVYRSLVELVPGWWIGRLLRLGRLDKAVVLERAGFVAGTNGGTEFARAENWALLPNAWFAAELDFAADVPLREAAQAAVRVLQGGLAALVGALLELLLRGVSSAQFLPGLAAQVPNGKFIRRLNEKGERDPGEVDYAVIRADFIGDGRGFWGFIDKLADDLMPGIPNDGIVNLDAMRAIEGDQQAAYVDRQLTIGQGRVGVHHSAYFRQRDVLECVGDFVGIWPQAGGWDP